MSALRRRRFRPRRDSVTEKPPYRIPSMGEIRTVEPNGLTAISTFSGCGGSSLGLRMAGWRVAAASEFVEAARDTYSANFPETPVDARDIRDVDADSFLELAGVARGELDLFEGSPPCSSFSTAGKREAGWGQVSSYSDTEQRTDDLFFEFARLVDGIQPRAFVAENVTGLIQGQARSIFVEIFSALTNAGYDVEARVLDAQWLGVPQARRRLIFIGFRRDLRLDPALAYPRPLPYRYSIRDAVGDLGTIVVDRRTSKHSDEDFATLPLDEPLPTITANGISSDVKYDFEIVDNVAPSFRGYAIEDEWRGLKAGEVSDRYLNLIRPDENLPLPTVTASGGTSPGTASVVHPTEPRKFSIAELRRLSGFPDDFVLTGSWGQQWERIGRAVPPPMYAAVGAGIARSLRSAA